MNYYICNMRMQNSKDCPCGVTIGTFDGVHRGHQLVLDTLRGECRSRNLKPVAITFNPHPLTLVAPERAPKMLEPQEVRLARLREAGVESILMDFTDALRSLTVSQWFGILKERFNAQLVVVGYDNTFGSDGMDMSMADYKTIGEKFGLDIVSAPVLDDISSSKIRSLLAEGNIAGAERMLGHPYCISGKVVTGRREGRKLGFPTANLEVDDKMLLPAPGVYAALMDFEDGERFRAVVNIGRAPTFSDSLPMTVEVHIIGFSGDIYGKKLNVCFLERLRDEKKFSSLADLKEAITNDIQLTKDITLK